MNPGRELDTLIAEKVMGLELLKKDSVFDLYGGWGTSIKAGPGVYVRVKRDKVKYPYDSELDYPRPYSTDIAAAWEVVMELQKRNDEIAEVRVYAHNTSGYRCFVWMRGVGEIYEYDADTAPHAICLAALKAVGVDLWVV